MKKVKLGLLSLLLIALSCTPPLSEDESNFEENLQLVHLKKDMSDLATRHNLTTYQLTSTPDIEFESVEELEAFLISYSNNDPYALEKVAEVKKAKLLENIALQNSGNAFTYTPTRSFWVALSPPIMLKVEIKVHYSTENGKFKSVNSSPQSVMSGFALGVYYNHISGFADFNNDLSKSEISWVIAGEFKAGVGMSIGGVSFGVGVRILSVDESGSFTFAEAQGGGTGDGDGDTPSTDDIPE